jgi:shikimate kinase
MRIFLIGFMGSGKTFWGRQLSRHTGLPFYDLDEEIAKVEKRTVQQIFHEKGEEFFRERERDLLEALTEDHQDLVVSCGGGTPCFFNNIEFRKKNGRVIWLNTSVDTLVRRLLQEKNSRPLIKNISDSDLKSFIIRKLQERRLYYEQADLILAEETISLGTFLKQIEDE